MPAVLVVPNADKEVAIARKRMGLCHEFTEQQLRKAYMTGCRKLAPDKGGDAEAFIKLQRAHSLLLPLARRPETRVNMASALLTRNGHGQEGIAREGRNGPHNEDDGGRGNGDPSCTSAKKYKNVNEAYSAIHGDAMSRMRGHSDYMKRDVRAELRAPEKIPEARLHETFEKISASHPKGPLTVSTHVVKPLEASTSVGHPIHDETDDYGDGVWLTDLQTAYGPT